MTKKSWILDHIKGFMIIWGAIAALSGFIVSTGLVNWPPYALAEEHAALQMEYAELKKEFGSFAVNQYRGELYALQVQIARIRKEGGRVDDSMINRLNWLKFEIERLSK